jgi:cell division control protein 45
MYVAGLELVSARGVPEPDNKNTLSHAPQLRSLILLDLGALVDLADFFHLPPTTTVHVIDSHRPHNLANIFAIVQEGQRDQIVVWDDGDIDDDLQEERTAWEALQVTEPPGCFGFKPIHSK